MACRALILLFQRCQLCCFFSVLLQVEKLMLAVQSCAYGSEDGVVTADMLKRVVTHKAEEHAAKAEMRAPTHV